MPVKRDARHIAKMRHHDHLASALREAAKALERAQQKITREADSEERLSTHYEDMAVRPALMDDIRLLIMRGMDEPVAVAQVASEARIQDATVVWWWKEEQELRSDAHRWRRDREIMRLAWAGKTNAEIAALIPSRGFKKISAAHVSRIIRDKINAGRAFTPGGRLYDRRNAIAIAPPTE